jgi:transcriptional regulator
MYLPSPFKGDLKHLDDFLFSYPFATLLTTESNCSTPAISHLPLLGKRLKGDLILEGHLARANHHAKLIRAENQHLALFHGPDAYISPLWYSSKREVPTWNYAVAHLRCSLESITEGAGTENLLQELTDRFESQRSPSWKFSLPEDLKDPEKLQNAIIGFRLKVTSVEFKLKLGQNRSKEDQEGMQKALGQEPSAKAKELLGWMKILNTGP